MIPIPITPPIGAINDVPIENIPQFIITIIFIIGIIIAIVFLIYGGIKWILSGGDKTKVESARGHIVAAIIGLVTIIASFLIFSFVFQILGVRNPLTGGLCIPTLQNPFCQITTTPTPPQTTTPTATPSASITPPTNTPTPQADKPTQTTQPKKGAKATKGGLPLR